LFAAVFLAAAGIAVAAVVLAAPLGSRSCPSGFVCHRPPTAPPLVDLTTFTGSLGWRVEYDPKMATATKVNPSGNELVLEESSEYDRQVLNAAAGSGLIGLIVRGFPASQFSPQAAMQAVASPIESNLTAATTAPSSDQLFGRPALGFHNAIGEVLEGNARTPQGPGSLEKLAVMAASSGNVTIAFGIVYPVQRGQNQAENPDRPFDGFGDQIVGTVRFPGDSGT
jgi:hypothetical protein